MTRVAHKGPAPHFGGQSQGKRSRGASNEPGQQRLQNGVLTFGFSGALVGFMAR